MIVGTKKLNIGQNNVIFVADCALNINPNAEQLKDIVFATINTAQKFSDIQPKVAMLSFSSFGSGGNDDPDIVKIRQAINLVRQENKDLFIELYKEIQKHKEVSFNWVKGHANNYNNNLCDAFATAVTKCDK